MERKTLHKRKGQWVTLSTSIIVASLAVSSGSVLAEEVDFTRGSSTIYGNSQLQASDSSNEIHPVEEDESLQAEQEETRQETQVDLTSGDHHKDVSQRDLLAYVVAQEAGSNSQEGIDAVLSTIYNRADANNSSAYEEITKPYQFTAYGSEAWRKRQNEDLTKVYASIDKHEAGTRTHQYQNFLASNYFYNSPEWKGHKNAANADLSSYVSSKQDIGGNTFFTPSSNFPYKKAETVEKENAPVRSRNQSLYKNTEGYQVKPGDTLYSIAKRNNLSVDQLKNLNHLTSNMLRSGQVLKVSNGQASSTFPAKKETSKPAHSRATKAGQTPAKTVTVKKGEYLYLIAQRHGLSVDQLKAMNKLTSNVLHSGQVLRVSNGQAPSSSPVKKETSKPAHSRTTKPGQTPAKTVTVKKGEYLYLIAQRHGLSVDQLKAMNKLTSNVLHSGQVLKVSNGSTSRVNKEKIQNPKPIQAGQETKKDIIKKQAKTVTVQKGDYLYKIARENGLTVDQLKALNNLSSNIVYAGQVLKLDQGTTYSPITNPKPGQTAPTNEKLPNLANANSRQVNYDVKLNSKNEPLRKSLSSNVGSVNSVSYFGQRFTVTRELNQEGQKFLELTQNGQVIGYVRSNAAVQVPQGQKVIYLDAGHGGSETGAYSFGVAEKDLNLNITRQLSNLLRGQGYKVIESRTNDVAMPLKQRTVQSNQIMPDLYISVHHNAMPQNKRGTSAGIETLYHNSSIDEPGYMTPSHHKYTNLQSEDKRLASIIQSNLVQSTGAVNRGTRAENLHVTRTSDVPSVLVELGFQDNASEFKKLTSPAYQTRLVRGLLNGINQYLN